MNASTKTPLLIFDLDGVLVDSKEIHFLALNKALQQLDSKFVITQDQHLRFYDGLTTRKKLEKLNVDKGLPNTHFENIWNQKQIFTEELLMELKQDDELISIFQHLKNLGINVAVASNSIKETVQTVLDRLGVIDLFDLVLSNNDVVNPKPHPEIYLTAFDRLGLKPTECIIVEDAPHGIASAKASGGIVYEVRNTEDVNLSLFSKILK